MFGDNDAQTINDIGAAAAIERVQSGLLKRCLEQLQETAATEERLAPSDPERTVNGRACVQARHIEETIRQCFQACEDVWAFAYNPPPGG